MNDLYFAGIPIEVSDPYVHKDNKTTTGNKLVKPGSTTDTTQL